MDDTGPQMPSATGIHIGSGSRGLGPERLREMRVKNGGGTLMSLEGPG